MGTRHLVAVVVDGVYKIAQYGQWDGYPSGNGVVALAFARTITDPFARQEFADKCRAASFITDGENDYEHAMDVYDDVLNWDGKQRPQLSIYNGADILRVVSVRKPGIKLRNSIFFAADSLFCEFAYVIDLDKGTFEVFQGFNEQPLADGERFKDVKPNEGASRSYYPIRHRKTFQLDALPDDAQFIRELPDDED